MMAFRAVKLSTSSKKAPAERGGLKWPWPMNEKQPSLERILLYHQEQFLDGNVRASPARNPLSPGLYPKAG